MELGLNKGRIQKVDVDRLFGRGWYEDLEYAR
jgi:hypothetical protein